MQLQFLTTYNFNNINFNKNNFNNFNTTALDDATRFLRATQQNTLGVQKRDVAVQAFASTLRFEHTLSRTFGGLSSRKPGIWLSSIISSKTEILRLVTSFLHFGSPLQKTLLPPR